ncbi:hypothetical protein [Rhodoblastus sp.]|uniref:hypothetical protein n=1 Tax=Rhodoblastus sp. TaxID=1962975 RepID=UPI003F961357
MRTNELFRTCANEYVAAAALACIGGRLERRVALAARRADLSIGAFVAGLVTDYDRKASPRRRTTLEMGMIRHDTPLLAGLRHVVETALEGAWDATWDGARDIVSEHSRAPSSLATRDASSRFPWSAPSHGAMRTSAPALKSLYG